MSGIWKIPDGIAMTAVEKKDTWVLCGTGFVVLPILVFYKLSDVRFDNISAPERYFVFPVVLLVIAALLGFFYCGVCFLLHCAVRVEITADMVSLKVGKITLRKLPADKILTVGFMEQAFGRHRTRYIPQLVLTTESVGDVLQNGEKRITKNRSIRQQLRERGFELSSKKATGYAHFERYFPTLWQGRNQYILLEFSQDRVHALRNFLISTEFLL